MIQRSRAIFFQDIIIDFYIFLDSFETPPPPLSPTTSSSNLYDRFLRENCDQANNAQESRMLSYPRSNAPPEELPVDNASVSHVERPNTEPLNLAIMSLPATGVSAASSDGRGKE